MGIFKIGEGEQLSGEALVGDSVGEFFDQSRFEENQLDRFVFGRFLSVSRWVDEGSAIRVHVPTTFHVKGLQKYLEVVERCMGKSVGSLEISSQPVPVPRRAPVQSTLPLPPQRVETNRIVRPEAPRLLISPAFELPYQMTERWARQNGQVRGSAQTLWLSGAPGSGKTHLIKQLYRWVPSNRRILVVSVMNFLHEWRQSMETKTQFQFSQRYRRDTDVLVIENIEQLRGKLKTQEELLFTVNAILDRGGSVAVTSSEFPMQLEKDLIAPLHSRFLGGLTVELPMVDRPMKEHIWRDMIHHDEVQHAGMDVLCFERLMQIPCQSIRDVRSLFIKVFSVLSLKKSFQLEDLSRLESALRPHGSGSPTASLRDPRAVIAEVAKLCGVGEVAISGKNRRQDVSLARRFVFLVLSRHLGLSNAAIAQLTDKDPSSVSYGIQALEQELALKRKVLEQWRWLCQRLGVSDAAQFVSDSH